MIWLKRILLALVAVFVVLQFIRPPKNVSNGNAANDISTKYRVPPDVQQILQTSCYDCHSNTTRYPWYAEVQPAGWWLNSDIQEAKRAVNFSEFAGYGLRRQYIKFKQIADQVSEEEMPLPSYLIIHTDARLLPEQRDKLVAWATAMRDTMKASYPVDSLERRR